jgi:hypothetical protein
VGCVLPSGPSPCARLSRPRSTMPDKTPQKHIAALRRPTCDTVCVLLRNFWGFPSSQTHLFLHATACGLRRTSTSSPKRMLPYCLRRTLKPSASAIAISKLYQHFRVRDHPCGLQDTLPTLNPSCSPLIMQLRHGSKARYGWVANPYRKPLLVSFPTGTFTLQDTPSFPRRDNDKHHRPGKPSAGLPMGKPQCA